MEIESEDKPPGSPLIRDFDMGNYLGRSNFFIKYEGANPTGTQKDRISRKHVENAIEHGYTEISVATCGNYGASIAYYARAMGIKAIVGIPSDYSNSRGLQNSTEYPDAILPSHKDIPCIHPIVPGVYDSDNLIFFAVSYKPIGRFSISGGKTALIFYKKIASSEVISHVKIPD